MNYNIVFSLSSFFYISLTAIVYFTKQRIKNKENKIYSLMIISNMIGLVVEVLTAYSGKIFSGIPIIQTVLLRLINIYFLTWIFLFTYYVCIITEKTKESTKKTMIVVYGILGVVLCFMPLHVKTSGGILLYSYGASSPYIL